MLWNAANIRCFDISLQQNAGRHFIDGLHTCLLITINLVDSDIGLAVARIRKLVHWSCLETEKDSNSLTNDLTNTIEYTPQYCKKEMLIIDPLVDTPGFQSGGFKLFGNKYIYI